MSLAKRALMALRVVYLMGIRGYMTKAWFKLGGWWFQTPSLMRPNNNNNSSSSSNNNNNNSSSSSSSRRTGPGDDHASNTILLNHPGKSLVTKMLGHRWLHIWCGRSRRSCLPTPPRDSQGSAANREPCRGAAIPAGSQQSRTSLNENKERMGRGTKNTKRNINILICIIQKKDKQNRQFCIFTPSATKSPHNASRGRVSSHLSYPKPELQHHYCHEECHHLHFENP